MVVYTICDEVGDGGGGSYWNDCVSVYLFVCSGFVWKMFSTENLNLL